MNVVIRTDSSVHIGLGHVMRSVVLAKELMTHGYYIKFATRSQNGDSIDYFRHQGFDVYELPKPKEPLIPKNNSDYAAWLQVPIALDAEQFLSVVTSADLVIIDHYAIGADWQVKIRRQLDCNIVVIDDLVRKHNADLIIDQTLMRTQTEYRSLNNTNDILTGCEYALLNPQFIARREQALDINCIPQRPKILISMGGIDNDNITLKVLRILQSQSYNTIKVTVLLGKKSPNYEDVKEFCILNDEWVEHKDFVDDMASTMLGHTLAIGAPGTTSWERACLGIPNIIIPLADNQLTIARNLVLVNASILVEKDNISRDLVNSCKMLIKKWSEYRQANLKLCDGLGVRRVVMSVNNLLNKQVNRLSIRRACENDIKPVFEWQCHSNTRKYALTTSVPKWDDHKSWMKQKLKSVKDFFYMITLAEYDESVGVIRLDRLKKGEYIVSIFVSPKHYGKGIAKHALNFVDGIHKDVTLHATVLENNIASQRLFTAANYQRVTKDKFIRLPIT